MHDPLAVAIFTSRGVRVGYLNRERAGVFGSKLDRGYRMAAIVERIKGSHLEGSALGLVMRVSLAPPSEDLEQPELPRPIALRMVA